jgi:hypothetical protein
MTPSDFCSRFGWEAASSTEVCCPFDLGPGRPARKISGSMPIFSKGRVSLSSPQLRAGGFRRQQAACTRPSGPYSPGVIFLDERGLVMFRKVTIALLATAALGMLAPDVVSARGGGGGGFHGGGGGFHGGFGGAGFYRGDGFGRGGFHAARFSDGRFRGAAIGGRGFRAGFRDGFRAGLIAGTSRSAKHMTGQRTRPEVVRCITSDCRLWHSYSE